MTESQVTEIVRALWSIEHELKQLNKAKKINKNLISKINNKTKKRNKNQNKLNQRIKNQHLI